MCVFTYICTHTALEQNPYSMCFPQVYHVSDSCAYFFHFQKVKWRDRHESSQVAHKTVNFLVRALTVNIYLNFILRLFKASGRWSSSPFEHLSGQSSLIHTAAYSVVRPLELQKVLPYIGPKSASYSLLLFTPALSSAALENKSTPLQWDSIHTPEDNYHVLNLLSSRLHVSRSSNCPQFDMALSMSHISQKGKGTLTTLHHSDFIALPKSAGLAAFTPVLVYCTLICSWTNIIIMSYSRAKKTKTTKKGSLLL